MFARWRNTNLCRRSSEEDNVRRFVYSYLARGLKRTIPQVYLHVVYQFAHPPKGRYSEDEKKVIEICFYHNPRKAVRLCGKVLNRGPRGILEKFNKNVNGKSNAVLASSAA